MKDMRVSVTDKVAEYQKQDGSIVCGNKDYRLTFDFDGSDWDGKSKTARFTWNNKYLDVPLVEDACNIPPLDNTTACQVGVFSNDGVCTSTNASVPCLRSVKCGSPAPLPVKSPVWETVYEKELQWYMDGDPEDGTYTGTYTSPPGGSISPYFTVSDINYNHPVLLRATFLHPFVDPSVNQGMGGTWNISCPSSEGFYSTVTSDGEQSIAMFQDYKEYITNFYYDPRKGDIDINFYAACGVTDTALLEANPAKLTLQVYMLDGSPIDPTA